MFLPPAAVLLVARLNGAPPPLPTPTVPAVPTTESCIKPRRSFEDIARSAARVVAEVARAAVNNR